MAYIKINLNTYLSMNYNWFNLFSCSYVFQKTCSLVLMSSKKTCSSVLMSSQKTCSSVLMSFKKPCSSV